MGAKCEHARAHTRGRPRIRLPGTQCCLLTVAAVSLPSRLSERAHPRVRPELGLEADVLEVRLDELLGEGAHQLRRERGDAVVRLLEQLVEAGGHEL